MCTAIKVDAPLGADKVMSHDDFGNVTTETMGPAETTYEYNPRNLLEKVTDPDNHVSWTWYDVGDLPRVTVDGEGRKTHTVYDELHRTTQVIRAWRGLNDGSGATLDCAVMRAAYDPAGGYLQQCYRLATYTPTGRIETLADANNNLTEYWYDELDRRTHSWFPSLSTPGNPSASDYEEITYNALDQMEGRRTRRGDVITYTNDALGRLLDRLVPDAPTHVLPSGRTVSHSYTHDAWGHIETATHDGETILYAYDGIGRVDSQTYAGGLVVDYDWDEANNLEYLTWPDGFRVDYVWDANNRVKEAWNGGTLLADVTYDALSRRDVIAYANGSNVNHDFSPRGDLTDHDHGFIGSSVDYDFQYNGVGQTWIKTISDASYAWVAPATGIETYAVNGLNQYTDISGANPNHDLNGNLILDHQGRSFGYDAENVLRTASGLAAGTATYRYHADGTRREKSYNGTTTRFYYMGGLGYLDEADSQFAADQEIAEYSGTGALLRRYIRLPGSIDETFLMIDMPSGTETWVHADRQGSVIATTDSSGAVVDQYRYSPYGRPGSEGSSGFPFRFTGQKLDPETGLYYYKARYYDPETGRFLQTDPIGYTDQMNLYAYVGNDPANAIDPSGAAKVCAGTTGSRLKSCVSVDGNGDGNSSDNDLTQAQKNNFASHFRDFIVSNHGTDISSAGLDVNGFSGDAESTIRVTSQFVGASLGKNGWGRYDRITNNTQLIRKKRLNDETPGAVGEYQTGVDSAGRTTHAWEIIINLQNRYVNLLLPSELARTLFHERQHSPFYHPGAKEHKRLDDKAKNLLRTSGLAGGGCSRIGYTNFFHWKIGGYSGC